MEKVRLATLAQNDTAGVVSRKAGIPLREMLGEVGKLARDGNFTPLLILFPKICKFGLTSLLFCVIMFYVTEHITRRWERE